MTKRNLKTRILSMILTLLPSTAYAEEYPKDITFDEDRGQALNEAGEVITQATKGMRITIKAKDRSSDGRSFLRWEVDDEEGFTYQGKHTDREVIDAAAAFINELLDGQEYSFWFLMENLWWPGLTFLEPEDTRALISQVHYGKKGFMLDTGHYLHTDLDLQTQEEAVEALHRMLDQQKDMIPYIKGLHLQQSLTGDYVKEWLQTPHELPEDPTERFCKVYEHIFRIDKHEPFTAAGVKGLVERIAPMYVTYEYITRSREELAEYLERGRIE